MRFSGNLPNCMGFRLHTFAGAACAVMLCCSLSAAEAPAPPNPAGLPLGDLVQWQIKLMQQEKWRQALEFCEQAIKDEGNGALQSWGPLFGTIYYRKGVCELKLEKWAEAMESFRICHEDFPNKAGAMNENQFENLALLRWADAAIGAEQWKQALTILDEYFQVAKQPRDNSSMADYYKRRAKCYHELGLHQERDKALEMAESADK